MADTPTTCTIKFHSNRHIEVGFSSILYVTPRSIAIAENLLQREYRGMRGKFNADQHRKAREDAAAKEKAAKVNEAEFHEKEDERLAEATAIKLEVNAETNVRLGEEKSARLAEALEAAEKSDEVEPEPEKEDGSTSTQEKPSEVEEKKSEESIEKKDDETDAKPAETEDKASNVDTANDNELTESTPATG